MHLLNAVAVLVADLSGMAFETMVALADAARGNQEPTMPASDRTLGRTTAHCFLSNSRLPTSRPSGDPHYQAVGLCLCEAGR